jgi:RNA polymerase sigma factor (TIGR02999 family)
MGDVTQLIARARDGDRSALDALFEILYPDLRRIAHARLSGHQRSHQLQTTALVNECYMKFVQMARVNPVDRAHFLAYSATVMRSVVVDTVRASQAERRGGDAPHVTLSTAVGDQVAMSEDEILDVHAALRDLAALDARLAQVVEMRYFGGMNDLEISQALGVTDRTVRRDWEKARMLLATALRS